MKLDLNLKNLTVFILLGILMGEAHEISHFIVGKVLCGCWPAYRDFNSWRLCECANGFWATAMGPVFSMSLAWVGMFLLLKNNIKLQSLGFMLIWANVPQARIATVLGGGGDEMLVIRTLTENTFLYSNFKIISIVLVFFMALPPIVIAFIKVKNKFGWLVNIAFMFGSLALWGAYLFGAMNALLKTGFLAEVWIMGTPLLITLHTILIGILFFFFRKHLFTMVKADTIISAQLT